MQHFDPILSRLRIWESIENLTDKFSLQDDPSWEFRPKGLPGGPNTEYADSNDLNPKSGWRPRKSTSIVTKKLGMDKEKFKVIMKCTPCPDCGIAAKDPIHR